MALLNLDHRKNGIQIGGPLDYCEVCSNINGRIDYGSLEYEEIFKIYRYSTSTCLCMEHFKGMLDHYLLVDVNEEFEEETEEQEIIEETIPTEEPKTPKKGKTKK